MLSVGNVRDEGIGAASAMLAVRSVVRGVAAVDADPRTMLDAVERMLEGGVVHGAGAIGAWIGILDPLDLAFAYASAGHPAPLLREADRVVHSLHAGEPPLGVGSRDRRALHVRTLEPGSALLLATDGLIEAQRDVIRNVEAVKRAFARLDGSAAPATMREMIAGGRAHDDEVSLLYVGVVRAASAADGVSTWSFDSGDALEGRRVRRAFVEVLRRLGYSSDARFCAELVFGELLGNVVRHAPGDVNIRLDGSTPDAVLHVLDGGRGFIRKPRISDAFAESGRGIGIVEHMVDDFSARARIDSGTHIRAVLRRATDGRSAARPPATLARKA